MYKFIIFVLLVILPFQAQSKINFVTVNEIKCSLSNNSKMNVGFDIDDTVLFSSPVFYRYFNLMCPDDYHKCLHQSDFWDAVNNSDGYSLPKEVAFELMKMHQKRGDDIYFITSRYQSNRESVTAVLKETFEIDNMNDVIFISGSDKSKFIKEKNIKIYYGDADSDMQSAIKANARPIRILRSKNSNATSAYNVGLFSEEVIIESDY